ncbi:MAG: hypothetical protein Kow0065_17700 [Methylomicrobium sp.]
MKKPWLHRTVITLCLCLSAAAFGRSTYHFTSQELYVPVVYVDGVKYEARLTFDNVGYFVLNDARPTDHSSDRPALYDSSSGTVTLPYVEGVGANIAYAGSLSLLAVSPRMLFTLSTIQQIPVLPDSGNQAPSAQNISVRSNLTTPYLEIELIGVDADNDTLTYVLDIPFEGTGYRAAFVEPNTNRLFVALRNDGVDSIRLPYRVSDGALFSNQAAVTITIGDISEGGLGSADIPPEIYSRLALAYFDGERFGSNLRDTPVLPSSIDLSGNFPIPGNQGGQGSCVGWATAYALKSFQEKVEEQWDFTQATTFSPAWIYNQINGGQDAGSRIDHALELIIAKGAATWRAMPYNENDFLSRPSAAAVSEALSFKGAEYRSINGIQQFKAALANKQPVVIGMKVYDSFNQLSGSDSVYSTLSGNYQGGHAVTIVGYDDNRYGGAFKVINSWGIGWGDNGFFWMPYNKVSETIMVSYVLTDRPNGNIPVPDVPVVPVREDLPNLQVASWSANYTPQSGGTGELLYEVINSGSASAPSGADVNLMLSSDDRIDSSDWYVVYEEIPVDLQPGGSTVRNANNPLQFTFPETLPAGRYYMAVWVDDLQEIDESNEQDNVSFGTDQIDILRPALADLAIDYWWASWDEFYGDGALEYSVINNGTRATSRTDWDINLVLSDNIDPARGNTYFLFYENAGFILNPGQYVYRDAASAAYFNLYFSQSGNVIPSGTYYMSLWVDDLEKEPESNEINNISTGNQLVTVYGFAAQPRSLQQKSTTPEHRVSLFNGKRIPENVLMRKVEITDRAGGGKSLRFTGEVVKPQQIAEQEGRRYDKVMKSVDYAVFPRTATHMMSGSNEGRHDKE